MIATDTPEKEALSQKKPKSRVPAQARLSNKSTTRKSKPRKLVFEEESSSEDELEFSDHSSDDLDEDGSNEHSGFPSLEEEPKENDYILAEFNTSPKKYYVGMITKGKDDEEEYEVSYLRKKRRTDQFFFPELQDVASLKHSDIKAILPKPITYGTTKRQNAFLKFAFNFDFLNVN